MGRKAHILHHAKKKERILSLGWQQQCEALVRGTHWLLNRAKRRILVGRERGEGSRRGTHYLIIEAARRVLANAQRAEGSERGSSQAVGERRAASRA